MSRFFTACALLVLCACNRKHGDAYKIVDVAAGGARVCATMKDGTVKCWGRDGTSSVLAPRLVSGITNAAKACVGESFVCAMTHDGHVSCLGADVTGVTDVACGAKHACAIASGKVTCWSDGTPPHEVAGTTGATLLDAGGATTCAAFGDGSMKCWGAGKSGQLGDGTFDDRDAPALVPGLRVKGISVGATHTCAVLVDETIACFGQDDDGELGDGRTEASATPRKVQNVNIAQEVSSGAHHTCARMGDATVHCWGKNDVNQAGLASGDVMTPTLVPGLYESASVAAGDDFTCVRMEDGWLRCFGVNDWGQLGDGTREIRNVPTPIRY